MKLFFENSYKERRIIAEVKDENEALQKIKEFCKERNFKIYYFRINKLGNTLEYDVGSHSEFFYLELK